MRNPEFSVSLDWTPEDHFLLQIVVLRYQRELKELLHQYHLSKDQLSIQWVEEISKESQETLIFLRNKPSSSVKLIFLDVLVAALRGPIHHSRLIEVKQEIIEAYKEGRERLSQWIDESDNSLTHGQC
jgi:hypothetical protein